MASERFRLLAIQRFLHHRLDAVGLPLHGHKALAMVHLELEGGKSI
jgi:hypothetical protein